MVINEAELIDKLINKIIIVEMSDGELGEARVVRLSPNKEAVQLDFACVGKEPIMFWIKTSKCNIIDIL